MARPKFDVEQSPDPSSALVVALVSAGLATPAFLEQFARTPWAGGISVIVVIILIARGRLRRYTALDARLASDPLHT
ncbi:hypothetical protein OHA98_00150 [Streptomyces sp. NBC_00654]|uniref:hypothetical protein n=1 Tax=Streptomyces sp. NBC_00654 TaxID=2975799 RepID=UPI00225AD9D3|nr:hypothetical protein [Streptomyces sp. NBC_00654]MCX4963247.1 hypothetical protein [Streptomyces sp. NBC_00654]